MRDPKANAEGGPAYALTYSKGRLHQDTAPTGGAQVLESERDGITGSQIVRRTTSLGRTTQHRRHLISSLLIRTVTQPDETSSTAWKRLDGRLYFQGPDGRYFDAKTARADGTTEYRMSQQHPAYGMTAGYSGEVLTVLPSGLRRADSTTVNAVADTQTGNLSSETRTSTINGRTTTSTYVAATRTQTTTSPAGRRSTQVFDAAGRIVRAESPGTLPIEFTYDAAGRTTSVTQGERVRMLSYGTDGYVQSSVNAIEETTAFTRDDLGRVLSSSVEDEPATYFGWDAMSNLSVVVPPGRPGHIQTFDSIGQQISYEPPATPEVPSPGTAFGYNLDRQLTSKVLPDGRSVTWNYDNAGRLDVVTTPSGNYDYNYYGPTACSGCAPGKLAKIATPASTLQFAYDGALLKSATWTGAVSGNYGLTYDNEFRVSAETVNASTVRYGYDADSLVTCASMTSCSPAGSDALRLTGDPVAPRISTITLGNTTENRTYNGYGELASLQAKHGTTLLYSEVVSSEAAPRDALGRIVVRTETTPSGTVEWKYEYDVQGRLVTVMRDDELYERLTYDANGNRIARETPSGVETGTYDAQDRLLRYGPYEYTYTANGELRTKTDTRTGAVTSYAYDVRGNLVRVDLPDGAVIEYVIDGLDRRVAKKKNGGIQKQWLYRDQLRIAAELDGNGVLLSRFVYASRSTIPDFVVRGGATYRVFSDHLGSPRAIANVGSPGGLVRNLALDEFGNVVSESGDTTLLPHGFAGGLWDRETGLVRFGARDYDPETGRWKDGEGTVFDILASCHIRGEYRCFVFGYFASKRQEGLDNRMSNHRFWQPSGS